MSTQDMKNDLENVKAMVAAGVSLTKISEKYNVHTGTAHKFLTRNGILKVTRKKAEDYKKQILEEFDKGESIEQISKNTGVSSKAVNNLLRKNNRDTSRHCLHKKHKEIIPHKDSIVDAFLNGATCADLGRKYNCAYQTISRMLQDEGIQVSDFDYCADVHDEIMELYDKGLSYADIARRLNMAETTIQSYCKKIGMTPNGKPAYRLKDIEQDIIKDYLDGNGCHKLSKKYECSESAIIKLLKRNDIIHNMYLKEYHIPHNFFDQIDTQEKAYILGFFAADGCNNNNNFEIGITDLDLLEDIRRAFNNEDRPIYREDRSENGWKDCYTYRFYSKNLTHQLTELGCPPNKTFTAKVPTTKQLPNQLFVHYVRGLFDGDGSIGYSNEKKNHWQWRIFGNKYITKGVQEGVIDQIGLNLPIYPHDTIFAYKAGAKEDIRTICEWLYKDATIYLQRKYDIYQKFLAECYNGV